MFPEVTLEEWQKVRLGRAVRECTDSEEEELHERGGQDEFFEVASSHGSTWLHS